MYSNEVRDAVLDEWFACAGEVSMQAFCARLGYPSRQSLASWAAADPRSGGRSRETGRRRNMDKRTAEALERAKRTTSTSPIPDDPDELRDYVRQLEMDNAILREMLDVLKADPAEEPAAMSNRARAVVVERLRGRYAATELCAGCGLARSTYYDQRRAAPRPNVRDELAGDVVRIFRGELDSAAGYRRVKAVLDAERGRPTSEKVVRDVMREQGLSVVYRRRARRYDSYAGETDEAPPNLLLRADGTHDFRPGAPGRVLASDVTQFTLPSGGRVYLSPVIDLFDGKPLAWSIGTHPDSALADSSLEAALATLPDGSRPIVHTDRGAQYRAASWKGVCARHGAVRSMSRKATSPDNAACEGFFGILKNEFFHGRDWRGVTAAEFAERLDAWMRRYSTVRLKGFRQGGRTVYETIDARRRRLGLAA